MNITAAEARRVVDAALLHAEGLGAAVCVAVVDSGGNLVALSRMDGATFATVSLAVDKAATSAGYGMPTQALASFASADPAVLAGLSNRPGLSLLPGGLPLVRGGVVVGGVAASGSARGEDEPVAAAGVAALASASVAV